MGVIPPRRIFISYAHSDNESANPDQRWLDRLVEMVAPLHMTNEIGLWTDREIKAGAKWKSELEQVIVTADVAVLLVSPAYLASRFIRESELPTLLYRAQLAHRHVDILPVILRYCLYEETTFTYVANDEPATTIGLNVFQSVNSPEEPLESLPRSRQDLVLRTLAKRMHSAFKAKAPVVR